MSASYARAEEEIWCVFDVIYLEKLSIQFALLKTLSIFDTNLQIYDNFAYFLKKRILWVLIRIGISY